MCAVLQHHLGSPPAAARQGDPLRVPVASPRPVALPGIEPDQRHPNVSPFGSLAAEMSVLPAPHRLGSILRPQAPRPFHGDNSIEAMSWRPTPARIGCRHLVEDGSRRGPGEAARRPLHALIAAPCAGRGSKTTDCEVEEWDGSAQPLCSGNSPGIQREASFAGKARRSGAREVGEVRTSRSMRAAVTRRAWRSDVPMMRATSPLGSSPR